MKIVISVALSVFISFLLLEVGTRMVIDNGLVYELEMWKYAKNVKTAVDDPNLGHRHQSNAEADLMSVPVRTNDFGFRGPKIDQQKADGVARLAFVGDSITFGWGVKEEETFAHQAVEILQKQGYKVDGFNQGIGNYNTTQELVLFKDVGKPMDPDLILLAYFINDAEPVPANNEASILSWYSAAWVVFDYRVDGLTRLMGEKLDWKDYYFNLYETGAQGWERSKASFGKLAKEAQDSDSQLIVFNIPEIRELEPYPFHSVTDKVEAMAKQHSVPFYDLLSSVQKLKPSSLWVTVPDPHPNGLAQTKFAEAMVEKLKPYLENLCNTKGLGCKQ